MRCVKALVQDNTGFERDFEDVQTSIGKFKVTFNDPTCEINEHVYENLRTAVPIEWRQNRNERHFRKRARPAYSIQLMGDWYEKDDSGVVSEIPTDVIEESAVAEATA